MKKKSALISAGIGLAFGLGVTSGGIAYADDDADASQSRFLEEVVVTARKRDEELQEVPLSITAFDGETIERMYGSNISEFSKFTPNVILARQPFSGNALFGGMRGIVFGDLEKSFDPSVGVVVDGVALVNNTGALIDTFDLEPVEILRGPQGTLFGRNTIAGVINVRRSRPTGEFGLKTQVRYASHDETDIKAVLNFPMSDTVAVKLAAFSDRGDGFQEEADFNLFTGAIDGTGDDIDGEDTFNFYASLLWEPTDDFSALFTYERGDDDSTLQTPVNMTAPAIRPAWDAITGAMFAGLTSGDPVAAATAVPIAIGATLGSGGNFCDLTATVIAPLNGFTREVGCNTFGQLLGESNGYEFSITARPFVNEIENDSFTAEFNYTSGDYNWTSITSWRESEEVLDQDNLGSPIELFNPYRPQDFEQFSTELRVATDHSGPLNYVAGLYYLTSEYEITQSVFALNALTGTTRETGGAPSPDGDAGQEMEALSVFGELYYELNDKTRLTLGGRWTRETKEFFAFQRVSGDASGVLPPTIWACGNLSSAQQAAADAAGAAWIAAAPDAATAAIRTAGLVCNDNDGEETWSEFTPRISVDYSFNDNVMGYASYSRGFRSGGWNGRAVTPGSIGPYDPETVDSYEAGIRASFNDGRLTTNFTLYRTEYEDKHESEIYAFGTATETVVNNAAKATVSGVEFEARYLLTDNVQIRFSFGSVDGDYDEFLQPANPLDRNGPKTDVSDVFQFAFAPEYNASIGFDAYQDLGGDWGTIVYNGNLSWGDDQVGNFGLPDPQGLGRNEFDAREELDLSMTWRNKWVDVAIYGKNLTESDNYLATGIDVGVFYFGSLRPGRSYGLELTKVF